LEQCGFAAFIAESLRLSRGVHGSFAATPPRRRSLRLEGLPGKPEAFRKGRGKAATKRSPFGYCYLLWLWTIAQRMPQLKTAQCKTQSADCFAANGA